MQAASDSVGHRKTCSEPKNAASKRVFITGIYYFFWHFLKVQTENQIRSIYHVDRDSAQSSPSISMESSIIFLYIVLFHDLYQ